MSSLSSSVATCQLNEPAQPPCQRLPFETSEMGATHVYLMRPVAPAPRTQPSELQNLHRNLAAGLPKKSSQYVNGTTLWYDWHGQ